MDKELTAFLVQLAAKLGTTVEHLWSALLKQASINGSVCILIDISLMTFSILLWFKTLAKYKTDKYDDTLNIYFVTLVIALIVTTITVLSTLENIITAFFNPEYWALMQILNKIK